MPKKILIVGAGIAGLALARALEARGLRYEIVERTPAPSTGGAGIFLPGNAAVALGALGLRDAVLARAHPCPTQTILDADGRLLHAMDAAGFWAEAGPPVALTRGALARIMREAVATPIRYGVEVLSVQAVADRARVAFSNGAVEDYDLVVGADGIGSTVRSLLSGAEPPVPLGRTCWRFLADNAIELPSWTVMLGRRRALLGVPMEDGRLYVYADADDVILDPHPVLPFQELKSLFADFAGPLRPILDQVDPARPIYRSQLAEVRARSWALPNVILVGDAAHACSPSMAEGASLAMEDALVLAECVCETPELDDALAVFERRRLARVAWVQSQCRSRDMTRSLPRPIRNVILRFLGDRLYRKSYRPLLTPFDAIGA